MRRLKILTSKNKKRNNSLAEDFHFNMVQLASFSSEVLSLALGCIIHRLTVHIHYKSERRIKKGFFFCSGNVLWCTRWVNP
jgi:hypothetical protein